MAGIDNSSPAHHPQSSVSGGWWIISNEGDVAAAAAASWRVISGITPAYRIFGSEQNVIASAVKASRYDARARRSMSVVAVI